jgi:hypothetical protein
MLPSTANRVPQQSSTRLNEAIRRQTEENVAYWAAQGPEAIERRLAELDREWDMERTLEANAAIVTLLSVVLGATVNRKWFYFPAVVGGFLLQHALQGWCPPLPIFRRLGVRTSYEIEEERHALKALRGDYETIRAGVADGGRVDSRQAIQAARS